MAATSRPIDWQRLASRQAAFMSERSDPATALGLALAELGVRRKDGSAFGSPRKRQAQPGLIALTYESLREETLKATESGSAPITALPIVKPAAPKKVTPRTTPFGWRLTPSGWEPKTDPVAAARDEALRSAKPPVTGRQPVATSTDFAERAHAVMRQRGQSVSPRDANYAANYKAALLEMT